jgi:cyclic pyranopterin phosphate synthase
MPEEEYVWLPRERSALRGDLTLVDVFGDLGVGKVRLTGGEPLLRATSIGWSGWSPPPGCGDLAITTNGVLLAEHAPRCGGGAASRDGQSDTPRPDRFRAHPARRTLGLEGLRAVTAAGFGARRSTPW